MLLFLDFDGVLHPFPVPADPVQLFPSLPRLEGVLREYREVKVVISSSWREERSLADLAALFSPDIASRIIGVLPTIEISSLTDAKAVRYREIQQFLGDRPEDWIALDDDPDLFPNPCSHLIQCNEGFGEAEEEKLRRALGRSVFFSWRVTNEELPHFEIRALAAIGAGLLMRHRGDAKAIRKLVKLSRRIDNYRPNETSKALVALCDEAAGPDGYGDDAAFEAIIESHKLQRGERTRIGELLRGSVMHYDKPTYPVGEDDRQAGGKRGLMMGIGQKIRSLHCGPIAGLGFEEIEGPQGDPVKVLPLRNVPFELQPIVRQWTFAIPEELRTDLIVDDVAWSDDSDAKFTEDGWSAFVSWMIHALEAAQRNPDFESSVRAMVIERRD